MRSIAAEVQLMTNIVLNTLFGLDELSSLHLDRSRQKIMKVAPWEDLHNNQTVRKKCGRPFWLSRLIRRTTMCWRRSTSLYLDPPFSLTMWVSPMFIYIFFVVQLANFHVVESVLSLAIPSSSLFLFVYVLVLSHHTGRLSEEKWFQDSRRIWPRRSWCLSDSCNP